MSFTHWKWIHYEKHLFPEFSFFHPLPLRWAAKFLFRQIFFPKVHQLTDIYQNSTFDPKAVPKAKNGRASSGIFSSFGLSIISELIFFSPRRSFKKSTTGYGILPISFRHFSSAVNTWGLNECLRAWCISPVLRKNPVWKMPMFNMSDYLIFYTLRKALFMAMFVTFNA